MATLTPLITTEWLAAQLHDEDLRIADCRFYLDDPGRGYAEYTAGHIPTARYFSLDDDLTGPDGPGRHPLPDATAFSKKLADAGIGDQQTVVVYDSSAGSIAARLWWMLRSLGHPRTYVLDGGWSAWASEPRSITTETPSWAPTQFAGSTSWTGIMNRQQIGGSDEHLILIDARAEARFSGTTEPIDPVAGHIPGAINLPYQANVTPTGHFLPVDDLRDRYTVATTEGVLVSYCGSGVTACHNLLALEVVGYHGALLYPGSWSDWCTSGGPIATSSTSK